MVSSCVLRIGNWRCQGGFLAGGVPRVAADFPCPKCNTEQFLLSAKEVAEARRPLRTGCPCCDGSDSPADYWLSALRTAQHHNRTEMEAILSRIGRVKTFDQRSQPVEFQYGSSVPNLGASIASHGFRCDPL
jgi:hypothetical protein